MKQDRVAFLIITGVLLVVSTEAGLLHGWPIGLAFFVVATTFLWFAG